MNDPLDLLLQSVNPTGGRFPETSRYHATETATLERDGHTVVYLKRRFVPPPESLAVLGEHTVVQGERLDQIAGRFLGDPEQFWRLADANRALDPEELTEEPGRTLRVTLPEGVPGAADG